MCGSEMSDEMIYIYSHFIRARNRRKVLLSLCECPKSPKQIAKELDIQPSASSKALNELKSLRLVKCSIPNAKRCTLFEITGMGEIIVYDHYFSSYYLENGC